MDYHDVGLTSLRLLILKPSNCVFDSCALRNIPFRHTRPYFSLFLRSHANGERNESECGEAVPVGEAVSLMTQSHLGAACQAAESSSTSHYLLGSQAATGAAKGTSVVIPTTDERRKSFALFKLASDGDASYV